MWWKTAFILSGSAGSGKNTLWDLVGPLCAENICRVMTTTSRPIRKWEVNHVDYHFISKKEFESKINNHELIEYAVVHMNYYGSTKSELEKVINLWKIPLYIIEPQWMIHLKPLLEDEGYIVTTIFLLPPSLDEMKRRLHNRWSETEEQLNIRLATAMTEFEQQDLYDKKIVNDNIEKAKDELITFLLEEV